MIIVFNGVAWGFEHVPFDAAFLTSLALAFESEPIHFYAEREHLRQTRALFEQRGGRALVWHELVIPERLARPRDRWLPDWRVCRDLFAEASRLHASRVIGCYLHAITGTLAFKAASLRNRNLTGMIVHHGSVLQLFSNRRYQPLLAFTPKNVSQLVLGDSIRYEVQRALPGTQNLRAIEHPYFFEDRSVSELAAGPITFSFLGVVEEMKGFETFARLAAEITPKFTGRARFELIGGTRVGPVPARPCVERYGDNGPLDRATYEDRLAKSTYAVFPFVPEYYKLIASGSVLDAFAAGKPIIALRNSQFERMFDVMGDIGYLCDDVTAMQSVIESIVCTPDPRRYREQSRNILAGRTMYTPRAVAEQLRSA